MDWLRPLLPYLKPYRRQLIIGPATKLTEAILELLVPYLMAHLVDRIPTATPALIWGMGWPLLVLPTLGFVCALICQYSASIASQGYGTALRSALFRKITTFSHADMETFGTSSLYNRLTGDVNQLQLAVAMLIRLVVRAPFLCIGGFVLAVAMDLPLSVILFGVVALLIFALWLILRRSVGLYRAVQKRLDALALVIRENLAGVRVIRAYARADQERERFRKTADAQRNAAIRVGSLVAALNPITLLLMNLGMLAVVWFGGYRVRAGALTTGQIIALINYISSILLAMVVVSNLVLIFTRAASAGARVSQALQHTVDVASPEAPEVAPGPEGELRFEGVSYRYHDAAEDELSDITLRAAPGSVLGIVGGTGSGKTTLVRLIPRLLDATRGTVSVGGLDVRRQDLGALRADIGFVEQKTLLFSGTIAEAIRWGNPDANDEDVREAARIAQAAEFIEALPSGYHTRLVQGGVNLSGGQRQRVAIARALVRKPRILVLDDSMSALDYQTDARLRAALRAATYAMTVVIVTQRVSSILDADHIAVMEDGRIVGQGTHTALLRECDVYAALCASQLPGEARA